MKTKKLLSILMMLVFAFGTLVSFSSCNADDDVVSSKEVADYYIEFSVLDKGTLSSSEAARLAAQLSTLGLDLNGVSLDKAKYEFDKLMNSLVTNEPMDYDAKFLATLKTEGRTVYSKKIVISRNGIRIQ